MNTINKNAKYSLIPGSFSDPELITLKAIHTLSQAGAIVLDSISNTDLLRYVRPNVPRYYTTYFKGTRAERQQKLNELVLELTLKYGNVVHIQGIEQVLFPHPAESLGYIHAFNIETDIVSISNYHRGIFLN